MYGGRAHGNNRGNSGSAMRGVFGAPSENSQQQQNNRRQSQDALQARQAAVAAAFAKANKEKNQQQQNYNQPQQQPNRNEFLNQQRPEVSPRLPPPSTQQNPNQNRLFPQIQIPPTKQIPQHQQQQQQYRSPPSPPNNNSPIDTDSNSAQAATMLKIISSISNRISQSENELSTVSNACESLHSHQSQLELKLTTVSAASTQIVNLKKSLEELKSVANEALQQSTSSTNAAGKLSLQMFEQEGKMQQVQDSARQFDQNSIVIDELRLAVDELKASAPLLANIDQDIGSFRREFHSRMSEESEFRESMKKKNQVLFGEIVRLGEAGDKDRGFARTEIVEMSGLLQNFEKRLSGSSDIIDRMGKSHSEKLVSLDGVVGGLESGLSSFGRDMQKIVNSVSEEMKARRNADDGVNNVLDEFRNQVGDKFMMSQTQSDAKSRLLEETIKQVVDGVRIEGERGRHNLSDELKSVRAELSSHDLQRSQMASSMRTEMASHTDQLQNNINGLKAETSETLRLFKSEEKEVASGMVGQYEDMKNLVLDLERQVYENTSVSNSRIDRTRVALEEVIRAEIHSRQNSVGTLEGRVRDIVQDCMSSLEAVGNEGRMAADALANRVNLLESGLTSVINGKISVVEEAVAARNHDQNEVNVTVSEQLKQIVEKEEKEHGDRTTVETELKTRVVTVEDRVDGEIRLVRQEADAHNVVIGQRIVDLKHELGSDIGGVGKHVDKVEGLLENNNSALDELTHQTSSNFDLVKQDIVSTNVDVSKLNVDIMDTNNKMLVNNVLSSSVDFVTTNLVNEIKLEEARETKKSMEVFVQSETAAVNLKEEAREHELIEKFDKQLELMKIEHANTLNTMREQFEAIITRERGEEIQRDAEMKKSLEDEMRSSLVQNVVGVVVEGLVSGCVGRVEKEEMVEKERKGWLEKKELEAELEAAKKKSDNILSKLVFVEEMVKNRERLETTEWSNMLGGGENYTGDVIRGGGRIMGGTSEGGPIISGDEKGKGLGLFPEEKM